MHWYNVATVTAVIVIGVLTCWLNARISRKALNDAQTARDEATTVEHRQWRRGIVSAVYEETLQFAWARADERLSAGTTSRATPYVLPDELREQYRRVSVRVRLHGSPTVWELFEASRHADDRVWMTHAVWLGEKQSQDDGSSPPLPLTREHRAVRDALTSVDETDRRLVDQMIVETHAPITASPYPLGQPIPIQPTTTPATDELSPHG